MAGDPVQAQGILKLTDAQLRSVGLSKQKSSYLRDKAQRATRGELDFSRLPRDSDDEVNPAPDASQGRRCLTGAHCFSMFTLRARTSCTGDFGIRMAIKKHYKKRKMPEPEQMTKMRSLEPYRSVACWYLWRSLDVTTM